MLPSRLSKLEMTSLKRTKPPGVLGVRRQDLVQAPVHDVAGAPLLHEQAGSGHVEVVLVEHELHQLCIAGLVQYRGP